MSDTPNADRLINDKLKDVNRLKGIVAQPDNVVLVTVEDVIEIFHELQPYTLKKLDEVVEVVPNEPSDSPKPLVWPRNYGMSEFNRQVKPSAIGDELDPGMSHDEFKKLVLSNPETKFYYDLDTELDKFLLASDKDEQRDNIITFVKDFFEEQTKLALEWALEVDTDDLIQRIRQLEASIKERSEG